MSILTYKIKHKQDFSIELSKAKQIAEYAVKTKCLSSKDVKCFGLKSIISNQILRKYSKNKTCKKVSKVNLIIPGQGIKYINDNIYISCLKLNIVFKKPKDFIKINQIEVSKEHCHISCELRKETKYETSNFIGVDRNATSHIAVCAIDNKIIKLGKKANHISKKYRNIRKKAQKQKKYKFLKKISKRESNIKKDIDHKVSRAIVNIAYKNKSGIVLENLKGIRKTKKKENKQQRTLKSNWSFYRLAQFIEYKANLLGVSVFYIDPYNTSKECSRCGLVGNRNKKVFQCLNEQCKHVDHADSNAAFNIKQKQEKMHEQLFKDRDLNKSTPTDGAQAETKINILLFAEPTSL